MERRKYKVVLKNGEDGWIVARVPALPGCISQGKGRKDALKNIKEAAELYIFSLKKHKEPIPPSVDYDLVEINV